MTSKRRRSEYNTREYRRERTRMLAGHPQCSYCRSQMADTVDHVPPLVSFPDGHWVGILVPACRRCNSSLGGKVGADRRWKGTEVWRA